MTLAFKALKDATGVTVAALIVGAFALGLATLSLYNLEETFGREMDYVER